MINIYIIVYNLKNNFDICLILRLERIITFFYLQNVLYEYMVLVFKINMYFVQKIIKILYMLFMQIKNA